MAFIPRIELCSYCDQPYMRNGSRHLYCSEDCSERAKNNGERRLCVYCSKVLTAAQPKYCSTHCKYEDTKANNNNRAFCKHCGREFVKTTKTQKFCSVICKDRGLAEIRQFICANCGKVFERKNCKGRSYKYCSHSCYRADRGAFVIPPVGTRRQRSDGYYTIQTPEGSMLEHRYVMEQKLGRKLKPGENVHHLDGDRSNNNPSNLELWQVSQPAGVRL